jgi:hypothetical protein
MLPFLRTYTHAPVPPSRSGILLSQTAIKIGC